MDRIHAGDIISQSFAFVRDHAKSVVVWSAVYLGLTVAMQLAMVSLMGPQFGADQLRTGAIGLGQFFLVFSLIMIAMIVVVTAIQAAIFRAALHPEKRELSYFRFGGDELRLFGLLLILGILFFIGFVIAEIAFVAVLAGIFAIGGAMRALGVLLAVLGGFGLFAIAIFFVVRLASAGPLTILRKRITIGEAWRLTRGHFWTLFGSYAIVAAVSLVVLSVITTLQFAVGSGPQQAMLQQMMHPRDPLYQQQVAAMQMQQYASFGPGRIFGLAVGSLLAGTLLALQCGTIAVATRLLINDEEPASVF